MSGTMDKAWRSFAELCLHPDTPEDQHREMRRAFYAGAQAVLSGLQTDFDPTEDPTEHDVALLGRVVDELAEFARDVREGRA